MTKQIMWVRLGVLALSGLAVVALFVLHHFTLFFGAIGAIGALLLLSEEIERLTHATSS